VDCIDLQTHPVNRLFQCAGDSMKANLIKEFNAMREVGIRVPERAYTLLETENLAEYEGVSVSDLADLLIQLSEVTA
jgi:hypothetical protein